jgi:hypothetical protein
MRTVICIILLLLPAMVSRAQADTVAMTEPDPLSPACLEAAGARIGVITIDNANIFDLDDPRENNVLFRTANRLHIRALQRIIRRQLLFKTGDLYSQRLTDESARILRSNEYLADAQIKPTHYANGTVDILVHTKDVWTLKPRLDFGRSGGKNAGTIGFEESNLLGTGVSLSLLHVSNVDSTSDRIEYRDRELGNTHYGLLAAYSHSDEGSGYQFDLRLPFYALDSHRSHGLAALSGDGIETLYDRGEPQAEFRNQENNYQVDAGMSSGLHAGWVKRYSGGLGFEENRFSPGGDDTLPMSGVLPPDRRFVYPFLAVEILQDEFSVLKNHDQIGRVEDIFHGTRLKLQLGYASTAFGSLDSAVLLDAGASKGFGEPGVDSVYTLADLSTRWEGGQAENLLLKTAASWYYRHSPRRMLYNSLKVDIGSNLDLDNPLYLGGDSGLRGYPLRYQGGSSSMLYTIEERYFTSWYPFRLFHIGGAVFFDVGRTWGDNPVGTTNLGWLRDVGFGLRVGNNRTGTGKVIHLDLAFPLDGADGIDSVQFLVEAKGTF